MNWNYATIVRFFDPGAEIRKPWNEKDFHDRFVRPVDLFLRSCSSEMQQLVVVSNGDTRFPLGEAVDQEGLTPTMRAIRKTFPIECTLGQITLVLDKEWGNNAGSASALNLGWQTAVAAKQVNYILSWNPEFVLSGHLVSRGLHHMEQHNLAVTGFYRRRWWERPQWAVNQNTASLWEVSLLQSVDGFSVDCDGNDASKVVIPGTGELAQLAGMDDFDIMLRVAKRTGKFPRWGMVGRSSPSVWQIDFPPGSERAEMLRIKIARQYSVMQEWAKKHFPDVEFVHLMDSFFSHLHQD